MDNFSAANNAKDFLQGLKSVAFEDIGPYIKTIGKGLDGKVELYEFEENNETQNVAIKTITKPSTNENHDSDNSDEELFEEINQSNWDL